MPQNGGIPSSIKKHKQNYREYKEYDSDEAVQDAIRINKTYRPLSTSSSDSDDLVPLLSEESDIHLHYDRFKPVCLRIIDFFADFHVELKNLIKSGLVFEYEDALIKFMCNYKFYGDPHYFNQQEIEEICEISNLPFTETYSRYKIAKS